MANPWVNIIIIISNQHDLRQNAFTCDSILLIIPGTHTEYTQIFLYNILVNPPHKTSWDQNIGKSRNVSNSIHGTYIYIHLKCIMMNGLSVQTSITKEFSLTFFSFFSFAMVYKAVFLVPIMFHSWFKQNKIMWVTVNDSMGLFFRGLLISSI